MRLLYDQNLSFRLVRCLEDLYADSAHVRDVGLGSSADTQAWTFAAGQSFTIVSKDRDFYDLSVRLGHPPKVVWVRRGNCSTADIETVLRRHHADVVAFGRDESLGTLILD